MAKHVNTRVSTESRATARIITVHPETRKVEAGIRDGAVKVVIKQAGPFFQWPKQNELWMLKRVGTSWELDYKLEENGTEDQPIEDLNPGDVKISSDTVYTKTSRVLLASDLVNLKGVAVHGANADYARPSGYGSIEWIGTVEPNNGVTGDTWVDTDLGVVSVIM